jgi:hypothetical protein
MPQELLIAILVILVVVCLFYLACAIHDYLDDNQEPPVHAPPPPPHVVAPRQNRNVIRVRFIDTDNILNPIAPEVLANLDPIENMMLQLTLPFLLHEEEPRNIHPPAAVPAANKKETSLQYYEGLEEHDNDSQNVHNPNIVNNLSAKYHRLVEICKLSEEFIHILSADELRQSKKASTLQQIRQRANERYSTVETENLALKKIDLFLHEVEKGVAIMSLSQDYPDGDVVHEDQVLALVWERIQSQANHARRPQLEIALFDQMIDGVRKSDFLNIMNRFLNAEQNEVNNTLSPVCVNGRVARMLTSLTLLDVDPILAEPEKDDKEIINLAYTNSANILQHELKKWPVLAPNRTMEEIYNDTSSPTTAENVELAKFGAHVRKEIEKELRNKYTDILEVNVLEDTIQKALSGIEMPATN